MSEKKDIADVWLSEVSRNKHYDEDRAKENQDLKAYFKNKLRSMKWKDLENAISEIGLQAGMPEYEKYREMWNGYQQWLRDQKAPRKGLS